MLRNFLSGRTPAGNSSKDGPARGGAIRVSVQTEPDNAAALRLYRDCGFVPVQGVQALMLPLGA